MSGHKRTRGQREADLILVAEMYLKAASQEDIARAVSRRYQAGIPGFAITRQQIGYDIGALHRRWLKTQLLNIDTAKARELARIDKLEREYWAAWEHSQEDAETETVKAKGEKDKPQQAEKSVQRKGQSGNPAFLAGIQWCIEQRCKMLGLNAPTKSDVTSGGQPVTFRVVYGDDGTTNQPAAAAPQAGGISGE